MQTTGASCLDVSTESTSDYQVASNVELQVRTKCTIYRITPKSDLDWLMNEALIILLRVRKFPIAQPVNDLG